MSEYQRGWSDHASESARRGAATRAQSRRELVDPNTGELVKIKQPEYREGKVRMPLAYALPHEVEPPACVDGYVQVCPVDDYIDALNKQGASPYACYLVVRAVLWADPVTGVVKKSQTTIARALGVSRGTAIECIKELDALGVVEADYATGSRGGSLRLLRHDELQRLSIKTRVGRAEAKAKRKRRYIERTITEHIWEEEVDG